LVTPPFPILYEDNHLLVVSKPAGLPTMGVAADVPSALTLAKEYIKQKYDKPGNVYLGVVSRLDAPTTGVLLMARTSKAAGRLTEQFRQREVDKLYWAVVEKPLAEETGRLEDHVRKDERHRKMHVTHADAAGAQFAALVYRSLGKITGGHLLEVRLETGRKHQIRLQLGSRGGPIVGDRKYGSSRPFPAGIALHSRQLQITHPVGGEPLEFVASLPATWKPFAIENRLLS
jgi:23S rRNA pseudouridine1911/1915/1917 synthase